MLHSTVAYYEKAVNSFITSAAGGHLESGGTDAADGRRRQRRQDDRLLHLHLDVRHRPGLNFIIILLQGSLSNGEGSVQLTSL